MRGWERIVRDLRALAEDLRGEDPESDAAHRVWVAAQRVEAQAEMHAAGLAEGEPA